MSMYDGWSPERIEAYRAYCREYYRKNREKICAQRRANYEYDSKHLGERREYARTYAITHRDQARQANKRCYEKRKARYAALEAENAVLKEEIKALKEILEKEARHGKTRIDA